MNVLITGGAGFLGSLLAKALLQRGTLQGRAIQSMVLTDLIATKDEALSADPRVRSVAGDLTASLPELFTTPFDAVFHLASAVSAECEADFDLGLRSNLDATRALLDACRLQSEKAAKAENTANLTNTAAAQPPLFFFSSSVAVYGSDPALPLPAAIDDRTLPTPQSSYGIHKFVCEQLVADYTRKGYIDGRAARLMTVSVRPGKPNGAASSFLSGIIREPLAGLRAVCPVAPSTPVALSSPATTIANILTVAEAPRAAFGGRTALNLPALTVTVQDMLNALHRAGGQQALDLVEFKPDRAIERIVGDWPSRFSSKRAERLGLVADSDFDGVIAQYQNA